MSRYAEIPWHTLTAEEVEQTLKTDRRHGLRRKIARQRKERLGSNSLFSPAPASFKQGFLTLASDVPRLLLLVLCLIGLCFSRGSTVSFALGILLFSTGIIVALYTKAVQIRHTMSRHATPRVTVIRSGKRYRAYADAIVPGDLICLSRGDIVPADARFMDQSPDFFVQTLTSMQNGCAVWDETSQKDAAYVERDTSDSEPVLRRHNMLFAGSHIVQGEATAIVVTIGTDTYHGLLNGANALATPVGELPYLDYMHRYVHRYSFLMWALLLPTTIISLLTAKNGDLDLFSSFFSVLSVTVASMCDQLPIIGELFGACGIVRAALPRDRMSAAVIKNHRAVESIAHLDRVVVTDMRFFYDGIYHPMALCAQRAVTPFESLREGHGEPNEQDKSAHTPLCRVAYWYDVCRGTNTLPIKQGEDITIDQDTLFCGLPEIFAAFRLDVDSLNIRILRAAMAQDGSNDALLTLNQGNGVAIDVRIRCTTDSFLPDWCQQVMENEIAVPLTEERRAFWRAEAERWRTKGCLLLWYAAKTTDDWILQGMIAERMEILPHLADSYQALKAHHVALSLFPQHVSEDEINGLRDSGMLSANSEVIDAHAWTLEEIDRRLDDPNTPIFVGVDAHTLADVLQKRRAGGQTIGVFGMDERATAPLRQAAVRVTCDIAEFHSDATLDDRKPILDTDVQARVQQGVPILVRESDLILRAGGGIGGILHAVRRCREVEKNMSLMLQYLLSTQFLRMTMILLPLLFGFAAVSPALTLIGGLWLDLGFVLLLAFRRGGRYELCVPGRTSRWFRSPIQTGPTRVFASVLTGLTLLLLAGVADSAEASVGEIRLFLFCALAAAQIATMLLFYFGGNDQDRMPLSSLVPIAIYLTLIVVPPFVVLAIPSSAALLGCAPFHAAACLPLALGALLYPMLSYLCARLRLPIHRIRRRLRAWIHSGMN